MRHLALILSMYFAVLALLPCQDSEDMINGIVRTTFQKGHSKNDGGSQEICPPFCTCSCCSTATQLPTEVALHLFNKSVRRNYPQFTISAVKEQPITIWLPPQ